MDYLLQNKADATIVTSDNWVPCVCVCVCVCARARACVRACACARVCTRSYSRPFERTILQAHGASLGAGTCGCVLQAVREASISGAAASH